MAFVNKTSNDLGYISETHTLGNTTTTYSSVISAIKVRSRAKSDNQYVSFVFQASAVTGTNIDIHLYGATKSGGTKFLLKSNIVTALTGTTKTAGVIDVQAYPAPFYYISFTTDDDNSSNTMAIEVMGDLGGVE